MFRYKALLFVLLPVVACLVYLHATSTASGPVHLTPVGWFDVKKSLPAPYQIEPMTVARFAANDTGLYFYVLFFSNKKGLILHTDLSGNFRKMISLPSSARYSHRFNVDDRGNVFYYQPLNRADDGEIIVYDTEGIVMRTILVKDPILDFCLTSDSLYYISLNGRMGRKMLSPTNTESDDGLIPIKLADTSELGLRISRLSDSKLVILDGVEPCFHIVDLASGSVMPFSLEKIPEVIVGWNTFPVETRGRDRSGPGGMKFLRAVVLSSLATYQTRRHSCQRDRP